MNEKTVPCELLCVICVMSHIQIEHGWDFEENFICCGEIPDFKMNVLHQGFHELHMSKHIKKPEGEATTTEGVSTGCRVTVSLRRIATDSAESKWKIAGEKLFLGISCCPADTRTQNTVSEII